MSKQAILKILEMHAGKGPDYQSANKLLDKLIDELSTSDVELAKSYEAGYKAGLKDGKASVKPTPKVAKGKAKESTPEE